VSQEAVQLVSATVQGTVPPQTVSSLDSVQVGIVTLLEAESKINKPGIIYWAVVLSLQSGDSFVPGCQL
jgi:hypothetical protein